MCRDVGGRGAGGEVEESDAARDQARVAHLADPQRAVDSFGDQVEVALVAGQGQLDIGVAREEIRQRRHDHGAGDECRRIDPHSPVRGMERCDSASSASRTSARMPAARV